MRRRACHPQRTVVPRPTHLERTASKLNLHVSFAPPGEDGRHGGGTGTASTGKGLPGASLPRALLEPLRAPDRDELYRRIDARVESMIAAGLEREVRTLRAAGYGPDLRSQQAIGYAGQGPWLMDPRPDYMEDGLLESVIRRGPIYRPTPT